MGGHKKFPVGVESEHSAGKTAQIGELADGKQPGERCVRVQGAITPFFRRKTADGLGLRRFVAPIVCQALLRRYVGRGTFAGGGPKPFTSGAKGVLN